MRFYFRSVAIAVALSFAPMINAPASEIAARSLLGEAERLIELALPGEALPILERVRTDYPGTEAAAFAQLRRAQALMFLHRYDAAIDVATDVVAQNPGTVLACWAQCVVGQSLVKQGRTLDGVTELHRVAAMLPDDGDLGPLNEAREVLGRVCAQRIAVGGDDLDAVAALGWDSADPAAHARVLAMLVVHRARDGEFADARATLGALQSLHPEATEEVAWAKAEVAIQDLRVAEAQGSPVLEATDPDTLLPSSAYTGSQEAARVYIDLARYYRRNGDVETAAALLGSAQEQWTHTANGAQILYELGAVLYAQGRSEEARAALARIPAEWPCSGYAAPALCLIGANAMAHRSASLVALEQLTSAEYPPGWRALAHYRLGVLLRPTEADRARSSFDEALVLYRWMLENRKAEINLGWNWREAIRARIDEVEHEQGLLP